MRLNLRDYQQSAVDRIIDALEQRPILVAPTGSGKTVMGTALVERVDVPTLWLAHRKELIEQAADRLIGHGLHVGVVMAGERDNAFASTRVASIHTLTRRSRQAWPDAKLIIIDECHHATADTYRRVLDRYPAAHVVGLTATPFRLDGRGLGDLFGQLVVAAHTDALCEAGVLHAPRVFASRWPDLRDVKTLAGDYRLHDLAERSNTVELIGDIVATWQQRAAHARTVAFAVDTQHSQAIVAAFRDAGVPAEHLEGATPRDQRNTILARLRTGQTRVVSNCMVLTEGWDLPALECAIVARPTASLNLHLQMIGRVMRASEGKGGAIVLDHAGNHHVHGPVTRRLEYSLDASRPTSVSVGEPLDLRRCGRCCLLHEPSLNRCPECGFMALPKPRRIAVREGEPLVDFDDASLAYRQRAWNAIEAEREALGYRPGWSHYRYAERFGNRPLVIDGELVDAADATLPQKRAHFEQLTATAERRGYKPGWASWKFKQVFGHWPRGFVQDVREQRLRDRFGDLQEVES